MKNVSVMPFCGKIIKKLNSPFRCDLIRTPGAVFALILAVMFGVWCLMRFFIKFIHE